MEDKYATIEQVAEHFQVSISSVRGWIRTNTVPALKVGGVYRLKIAEVDAAFKKIAIEHATTVIAQHSDKQVTVEVAVEHATVLNPDQDI